MNRPRQETTSAEARSFLDTTLYLDQIGLAQKTVSFLWAWLSRPRRMLRCLSIVIAASPMKGVRDYLRVIYHWIEASHLARTSIHDPPSHIHAHFINGPTSLAMFLGFICDIPFSFTMHASMIWRDPIALANKLQHCAFCVSISEYNRDYIVSQYGKSIFDKIHVVRCGIEPESIASFTHKQREQGLEILAVGHHIWTAINGKLCVAFEDPHGELSGKIAFQIHGGPPQTVQYRVRNLTHDPKIELAGMKEKELKAKLTRKASP